jgi:hypothetical protein
MSFFEPTPPSILQSHFHVTISLITPCLSNFNLTHSFVFLFCTTKLKCGVFFAIQ